MIINLGLIPSKEYFISKFFYKKTKNMHCKHFCQNLTLEPFLTLNQVKHNSTKNKQGNTDVSENFKRIKSNKKPLKCQLHYPHPCCCSVAKIKSHSIFSSAKLAIKESDTNTQSK